MPPVPARRMRVALSETPASSKMTFRRPEMPLLGPERRRITFQQVELGYDENTAKQEAKRCLRCDICKRCGKCVTICRDKMGIDALQFGYLDSGEPGFDRLPGHRGTVYPVRSLCSQLPDRSDHTDGQRRGEGSEPLRHGSLP